MDQSITASQITSSEPYMYKDVASIDAYNSSVWLVKFATGQQLLQVWHKKAKIEDIVEGINMQFSGCNFTVSAVDVGSIWIHAVEHMLSNGRMVNQNMEVVV